MLEESCSSCLTPTVLLRSLTFKSLNLGSSLDQFLANYDRFIQIFPSLLLLCDQICQFAMEAFQSTNMDGQGQSQRISDVPVVAFGSRAHLERQALATVRS